MHRDGHGQGTEDSDLVGVRAAESTPSAARRTKQRSAIRHVFDTTKRPLAPAEVLEKAQQAVPGIGLATVYRNVRQMAEEGELRAVEIPGQGARYELAGLSHHHHFMCRTCGRVFDVHGCPGGMDRLVPKGFRLESHELLMYGECAACVR